VNGKGTFRADVPIDWVGEDDGPVTTFRDDGRIVLIVSVGKPDGSIQVCSNQPCREGVARSLDELDGLIRTFAGTDHLRERRTSLRIDGCPGTARVPAARSYVFGPPAKVNLFAIVEARPVILTFPFSYDRKAVPTRMQLEIASRFHVPILAKPLSAPPCGGGGDFEPLVAPGE
jgi:hypothetical protein